MSAFKLIYVLLWVALSIGVGEVLVNITSEIRGAAISVYQHGPISHKLFTEQLTDQK